MLNESIVLFCGAVGQRMEPVGVVARTVVNGPLLHACGHAVGDFARQGLFVVDSIDKCIIGFLGKILKHLLTVEDVFSVILCRTLFGSFHRYGFTVKSLFHYFKSQL